MSEPRPLPPGLAALWHRPGERVRPGRRPGLTVGHIADAGVALADAEGLDAVSMARVAERLGVTTMALYRYVTGKEELLAVMYDAALAAPEPPDDAARPWRERLADWCRAQLDLLADHPWAVRLSALQPLGPNRVRWIERGLAALEQTPLPAPQRVALVGTLSLHVLAEAQIVAALADRRTGRAAEPHPALVDFGSLLRSVVDPAQHPRLADAIAHGAFDESDDAVAPDQQELALTLLLDGAAALVARYEQHAPTA